jgi:hypothetical protein
VLNARLIRYRRERSVTPQGTPSWLHCRLVLEAIGVRSLSRFILLQHHQGQVTVERLIAQLRAVGISISQRQVMRLLIDGQDDFPAENRDVLRAGLRTAAWTVDDTGARHARQNGFCTQIGKRPLHLVRLAGQQAPIELPRSPARRTHFANQLAWQSHRFARRKPAPTPLVQNRIKRCVAYLYGRLVQHAQRLRDPQPAPESPLKNRFGYSSTDPN